MIGRLGKKEFKHFGSIRPPKGKPPGGFHFEKYGEKPIVQISEKDKRIVIEYVFPGFSLTDRVCEVDGSEIVFKMVTISSTGVLFSPGRPLLPSFGRYVQIPYNCSLAKPVVKTGLKRTFPDILVFPAQEPPQDREKPRALQYDEEFYSQDILYPETNEIVRVNGPFIIDGYFALLVHVTPFQYEPKKRKLTGYGSIRLTLALKQGSAEKSEIHEGRPGRLEAFDNLFLNPGGSIEQRLGFPPKRLFCPVKGPEFLIIHADQKEFKKAADELAQWKNSRGLITETMSVKDVPRETVPANSTQPDIKGYIRDLRGTPHSRLRYLLLLGDVDSIPPGPAFPDYPNYPDYTDYYYSTKDDPCYPLNTMDQLVYPWLSIGRIPVSLAPPNVVGQVVKKIIAYESNPPLDQNYYRRITLASYDEYIQAMEATYNGLSDPALDVERIYRDDTNTIPSLQPPYFTDADATSKLVSVTTDGQLIMAHLGHGYHDGWCGPEFTSNDLSSVTGDIPSIFYSINCSTGEFDKAGDCFAEKLLKMKGGAPAVIAAIRNSGKLFNEDLIQGLFDALFGGILPTFHGSGPSCQVKNSRIGDILNYGKSYLPIGKYVTAGNLINGIELCQAQFRYYHVIGDPTLEQWTDVPLVLWLEAEIIRTDLHIHLPVSPGGCVLTIWCDKQVSSGIESEMLMRIESPPRRLTIPCPSQIAAGIGHSLRVCCWAPGFRFAEARVRLP